jgi:hypothetical protein
VIAREIKGLAAVDEHVCWLRGFHSRLPLGMADVKSAAPAESKAEGVVVDGTLVLTVEEATFLADLKELFSSFMDPFEQLTPARLRVMKEAVKLMRSVQSDLLLTIVRTGIDSYICRQSKLPHPSPSSDDQRVSIIGTFQGGGGPTAVACGSCGKRSPKCAVLHFPMLGPVAVGSTVCETDAAGCHTAIHKFFTDRFGPPTTT